ncbi:MAG: response regulator [Herbaspirillum huttiense]|uniref:phosphorylase family protein n=1 Tax=Herbaspirillum huttiense TaxID=863372 RepID=UPI001AC5AA66|nr:response regulator [Herbaspirillum huttiense]MBN9356707.1 response regulator [Herbaspirillum huttiense]
MKILIVDDNHGKVELIAQALKEASVSASLTQETSGGSARRRLRSETFDLLLIDLNLPDNAGFTPSENGGINFFDLLLHDAKANLPEVVLFVTSEDGLVEQGKVKIEERGATLCVVSENNLSWRSVIIGKTKLASARFARKRKEFDVAVITALGSPELEAILNLDYGWRSFQLADDPTTYYKGSFKSGAQDCSIVAASAMRKGMAASAALATKLVLQFKPRLLAMTGICAGIKGETNLGDVVVGDPTWDWGSGKHAEEKDGSVVFKLSPRQKELNLQIANISQEISGSAEFRQQVRARWDKSFPAGEFGCHVGPMASGASVVAHSETASEIAKQNRDLIAIEMEAFAVMVACEYATNSPLKAVAIKSVCDFADKDKRDDWQAYASYTSAMFADELFRRFFRLE